MRRDWRRYAAPAAFLLAATIAIVLIRNGIEAGGSASSATTAPLRTTRKTVAVTTTTKQPGKGASTRKFYAVEPGDSFGVISSKTGIPVTTIERLNPGVSSTSLVIGQKIRIR